MKNATRCVLLDSNDPFGATSPPIYQTATFCQPTADEFGEYDYSRTANPTRSQLEKKLADLEFGAHAAAFASGMAAISAVCRLVNSGEEIIAGDDLYGGTIRLLERLLPQQGISVRYVDTSDNAAVRKAISDRTKLILIETPTNPLLRVADIAAIAEIAHANDTLLAIDNTMLSPCLQNPLCLGADIVIHSATKFLCGHSDVTAGAVVTADEKLHRRIAFTQNAEGAGLSPFDSWLLLRGIKTLALRVEKQNSSALKIAEFLAAHRAIGNVYYPMLAGHPGRDLHSAQAAGGGSVISFTTGDPEFSRRIAEATRLFSIAVSFGSVNSSISLPCRMSHASIPVALREKLAPPPDLVRISVGVEDLDDLAEDLNTAISIAAGNGCSLSERKPSAEARAAVSATRT
jgi:cystathionine beta-lyase